MHYFLAFARLNGHRFQFVVVASDCENARDMARRSPFYPGAVIVAAVRMNVQ